MFQSRRHRLPQQALVSLVACHIVLWIPLSSAESGEGRAFERGVWEDLGAPVIGSDFPSMLVAPHPQSGRETMWATTVPRFLVAVDLETGEEVGRWQAPTIGRGFVADGKGHLYLSGIQGNLARFDIATGTFERLGRFPAITTGATAYYTYFMDLAEDGAAIYAGGGGCRLARYDIGTGKFTALGPMKESEKYVWPTLTLPDGRIMAGIAEHVDMSIYDPKTERTIKNLLPQSLQTYAWIYGWAAVRQKLVFGVSRWPHVAVFDLESDTLEKTFPIPDVSGDTGLYRMTVDRNGNIYASVSGTGEIVRIDPQQGIRKIARPVDGATHFHLACSKDGRLVGLTRTDNLYFVLNPTTGKAQVRRVPKIEGSASPLQSVARGPEGAIYGGSYPNLHLFRTDPETGKTIDLGKPIPSSGEIYDQCAMNGKLYTASYVRAHIVEYDPAKPWNFRQLDDPAANPRRVVTLDQEKYNWQYRPIRLVAGPQGRLYSTSRPAYGKDEFGNTFSMIDPQSGDVSVWPMDAFELAADNQRVYVHVGDSVHVFSPQLKTFVAEYKLPAGGCRGMAVAGKRLCVAASGRIDLLDPTTGQVLQTRMLSGNPGRPIIGDNGQLYVATRTAILQMSLSDLEIQTSPLAPGRLNGSDGRSSIAQGEGGALFAVSGTRLLRYRW